MRFGKKLLAAIERGEWVRRRSWPKWHKIRSGVEALFIDKEGRVAVLNAAAVLADDWVIVRRKKRKAPKAPVADDPRYEPVETMPIVGDKVAHPNGGPGDVATVEKILGAGDAHRWRVEADSAARSLNKSGYGWRILKRRNVFADPKPGDVIGQAGTTLEVRFADAEAVMLRWNSGNFAAYSRKNWAAFADSGWTVQKLGA